MSFQEEKRKSIKRYLLNKIRSDDKDFIQKTAENFQISVTSVRRYLQDCLEHDILKTTVETVCGYSLTSFLNSFTYQLSDGLNEDIIYQNNIWPVLSELTPQAERTWSYAFMEMMNNAIEHSEGSQIHCQVYRDILYTEISIVDNGIGIFKKIGNHLKQELGRNVTFQNILAELYKGKLTTAPSCHSGEGIFFTSRMLEEFAIWSDNTIFSVNSTDRDRFVQSHLIAYHTRLSKIGTMVVMKLENQSTKLPKDVFNMFAPLEEGFIKTSIPLREVCPHGDPIARSQARRLLYRLEDFRQVEFDCAGIDFMGQGFADEIFRVFQNQHPEIEFTVINGNKDVLGMIQHVKR